jgi:hypothetical protein
MDDAVSLVAGALRHKLTTHGAGSLTRVEWQLLRVSSLLHALNDGRLAGLLGAAPVAEITGIADGLDAIGASEASTVLHYTVREINAANAPGQGRERGDRMRLIAERLGATLAPMRAGIEQQLLDFAFKQPELMADASGPASGSSRPE